MRLAKVTLSEQNNFWSLGPLCLNPNNKESNFFDLDTLSEKDQQILEKSIKLKEIILIDENNTPIDSISQINNNKYIVDVSDIEDNMNDIYADIQVVSVTFPSEEETNQKESFIEEIECEALSLLDRQIQPLKTILKAMSHSERTKKVLEKAFELENKKLKRKTYLNEFLKYKRNK